MYGSTPRCLHRHRLTNMEPAAQGMRCALCGAAADVHCAADAAFLCGACDADVHGANFLASRHRRTRISMPKGRDDHDQDVSASASTSCLSTADSAPTTPMAPRRRMPMRRPTRGESMLHVWAKRTAIVAPGAKRRRPTAAACALQQDEAAAQPRMPLRVGMAAAHGSSVHENADAIRRLEACARGPGRLVVAVASSMEGARVKRVAAAMDTEEGWGECS